MVRKFFIKLSIAFLIILSHQSVEAQQTIAQEAFAIFEQTCLNCHGPFGPFSEQLTIEYPELIEDGSVIPGDPEASEFYRRLLGPTENGAQMPFNLNPLSQDAIDTIYRWIEISAPNWDVQRDFILISTDTVLETIENHVQSLATYNRSSARYFILTHLYNAGVNPEVLDAYKIALSKLINSLSWGVEVVNPEPIDQQETILHIDLRRYEWDVRKEPWTLIEQVYPYSVEFNPDTQAGLHEKLTNLRQEMECDVPYIHVDWFLATASLPPLYHDILDLPETLRELEQLLDVDVAGNIQNAPGVRVWRAGLNESRVSSHNRVLERHNSRYGAYWKSYDFAGSVGAQNILAHPLSFKQDGGEMIFNLPNGLQAYYISDAAGKRIDSAPINIVSNPAASDPVVRNGLSCIGCHTEGMQTFKDVVRAVIENTPDSPTKVQGLRLYVAQSEMNKLIDQDKQRYRTALEATGGVVGGVEPVHRFVEVYQGPIESAYAAAAVGLETEAFLQEIGENQTLRDLGLAGLLDGGTVKRDVWTSNFTDIITILNTPDTDIIPPVTPPIDRQPGEFVYIPDVNLRTALESALGISPGATITVEDMATLTRLNANDKGVSDLTGLEAGIQLQRIDFHDNSISDLSPLAGLTNLAEIRFSRNKISDLSPLADLTNLSRIEIEKNQITDLSALQNMVKLNTLLISDNPISDISPLANLISLERLHVYRLHISDFSPLADLPRMRWLEFGENRSITSLSPIKKLTRLERLAIYRASISDITPLMELTQLERLDIVDNLISDLTALKNLKNLVYLRLDGNLISNVSPLSELTQLKSLKLRNNLITDISPLAVLTNLESLDLRGNSISDFSPLNGLPYTTNIDWQDNPGDFIRVARKIEGPWLWMITPTGVTSVIDAASSGTDFLAKMSDGVVTELDIAANGAIEGSPVGDKVWTAGKISPTGNNNINLLVNTIGLGSGNIDHHVAYGSIRLHSPQEQNTTMLVGGDDSIRVWLDGKLVHSNIRTGGASDFQDQFPVTLSKGTNILLVAVYEGTGGWSGFFGFTPEAEYSVLPHAQRFYFSREGTQVATGDTFTIFLNAKDVTDLAGWQGDITFDPAILKANSVSEGDFLHQENGQTHFWQGTIDNNSGRITGIRSIRTSEGGVSAEGIVLSISFTAKANGDARIELSGFQAGSDTGKIISSASLEIIITVVDQPSVDVGDPGFSFSTDATSVLVGDTFTLHLNANEITDLAGWSSDITFDPDILEVVTVSEGDFLKANGITPFFLAGTIDNTTGKISGLNTARIGKGGVDGTGTLLVITLKAKKIGTTTVALSNFQAGSSSGVAIPFDPVNITITVEDSTRVVWDVNEDGTISVFDLILVSQNLSNPASTYPNADVNGDGVINILDLIIVGQHIGETTDDAASPTTNTVLTSTTVQEWIRLAQAEDDGSHIFRQGIENLQKLIASLQPEKTALLANYPNPFNPETWIPYQLATPAEVTLTIYSANGAIIRTLALGHQPAGMYQNRNRAAYWDGKNEVGESVSNGIYFYTLTAGSFTATRKMLILK